MIPRQQVPFTPYRCAFMTLRNGKVVGLSRLNSTIDGVYFHTPPSSETLTNERGACTSPREAVMTDDGLRKLNKDVQTALQFMDEPLSEGTCGVCEGQQTEEPNESHQPGKLMEAFKDQDMSDGEVGKKETQVEDSWIETRSETQTVVAGIGYIGDIGDIREIGKSVALSSTPLPASTPVSETETYGLMTQNKMLLESSCSQVEAVQVNQASHRSITRIHKQRQDKSAHRSEKRYSSYSESDVYHSERKTTSYSEGLEQHAFIDLSKKAYGSIISRLNESLQVGFTSHLYTEDDATSPGPSPSSSVSRSELECLSDDEEYKAFSTSHHAKWSEFHHWRREWYLNRFSRRRAHNYVESKQSWLLLLLTYIRIFLLKLSSVFGISSNRLVLRKYRRSSIVTIILSLVTYPIRALKILTIVCVKKVAYLLLCTFFLFHDGVRSFFSRILLCASIIVSPGSRFCKQQSSTKKERGLVFWFQAAAVDFLETKLSDFQGSSALKVKSFIKQSEKEREETLNSWKWASIIGLIFFALLISLCLLTYWTTLTIQERVIALKIPRPEEVGLRNTHNIFLKFPTARIPAWHVLPSSHDGRTSIDALSNGSPIFLHLRNTDAMTARHRVSVYDILSTLGYHVFVPVFKLSADNAKLAWKWIRTKAENSSVFLWGDNLETSDITSLAKDLCKEGMPPAGVVIEVKPPTVNSEVTTLEVWSCNCTTTAAMKSEQYGHVKCPLRQDDIVSAEHLYTAISRCLNTIVR